MHCHNYTVFELLTEIRSKVLSPMIMKLRTVGSMPCSQVDRVVSTFQKKKSVSPGYAEDGGIKFL